MGGAGGRPERPENLGVQAAAALLLPAPPGLRRKRSAAQRKARREQEARAETRIARLHLVGLTSAVVIVMGVVLVAVLVMVVGVLVSRH